MGGELPEEMGEGVVVSVIMVVDVGSSSSGFAVVADAGVIFRQLGGRAEMERGRRMGRKLRYLVGLEIQYGKTMYSDCKL